MRRPAITAPPAERARVMRARVAQPAVAKQGLLRRFVAEPRPYATDACSMTDAHGFYAPLDPATLAAARRGEPRAFASIYGIYGRACFNLALRILGDEAGASDVVQDVFVRLMSAIRRFRGDSPFGAWLKRMVANATVDELRRRRWLVDDEVVLQAVTANAAASRMTPETSAEAWQLLSRLKP